MNSTVNDSVSTDAFASPCNPASCESIGQTWAGSNTTPDAAGAVQRTRFRVCSAATIVPSAALATARPTHCFAFGGTVIAAIAVSVVEPVIAVSSALMMNAGGARRPCEEYGRAGCPPPSEDQR